MDIEACVWPGENALHPLRAEKFPADKKRQHLAGEDLRQPRVVDPQDQMEDIFLVPQVAGSNTVGIVCFGARVLLGIGCAIFVKWRNAVP